MRILVLQERTVPYFIQNRICRFFFISSAVYLRSQSLLQQCLSEGLRQCCLCRPEWPFKVHAQWSTQTFQCLLYNHCVSLLSPSPMPLNKSLGLPSTLSPSSQPLSHCSGLSLHYLLNEPPLIYQALNPIHLPMTYSSALGDQIDGYLLNSGAKTWSESLL